MSTPWIPTTDVAKMIRAEVKAKGLKASVRSSKYAGGASIRVILPADATDAQVESLRYLQGWSGSGFDGMTDSAYYRSHRLCSEHGVTLSAIPAHFGADETVYPPCCAKAVPVHMGVSYVFVERDWR